MKTGKGFLIVLVNQKPPQKRQCTNLPTFLELSSTRTLSCYEDGGAWADCRFFLILGRLKEFLPTKCCLLAGPAATCEQNDNFDR